MKTMAEAPNDAPFVTMQMQVSPNIQLLNQLILKAKKIAVRSIHPVYTEDRKVQAFKIQVEGPPVSMNHFNQLIAGLKII